MFHITVDIQPICKVYICCVTFRADSVILVFVGKHCNVALQNIYDPGLAYSPDLFFIVGFIYFGQCHSFIVVVIQVKCTCTSVLRNCP